MVASVLCVVAPTIGVLGALRVVQGLGVAATSVVAMAVVRDLFSGSAFARLFSRLMLVMGLAPILAPTVGSAVLEATNWRGVFVVLAGFGVLLTLTALVALRETLPPERRRRGGVGDTLRTYRALLRDRVFVGLVLVAGFAMAAVFSYVAGSIFVFQDQYGLDERQFGIAFGAGAVGLIAATQINVRLLRRYTPQRILVAALIGGTSAGALLIVFAATGFGGLATLLAALWLVLFSGGLAMPNSAAVAMTRHGEAAGTAAALLGAVQFGTGAIAAPLVGVLGNGGLAMATVVAGRHGRRDAGAAVRRPPEPDDRRGGRTCPDAGARGRLTRRRKGPLLTPPVLALLTRGPSYAESVNKGPFLLRIAHCAITGQ